MDQCRRPVYSILTDGGQRTFLPDCAAFLLAIAQTVPSESDVDLDTLLFTTPVKRRPWRWDAREESEQKERKEEKHSGSSAAAVSDDDGEDFWAIPGTIPLPISSSPQSAFPSRDVSPEHSSLSSPLHSTAPSPLHSTTHSPVPVQNSRRLGSCRRKLIFSEPEEEEEEKQQDVNASMLM